MPGNPPNLPTLQTNRQLGAAGQWQVSANPIYLSNSGDAQYNLRRLLWYVKQLFIGAIGNWTKLDGTSIPLASLGGKWVVAGSSDAYTAGMDGVDRWNFFDGNRHSGQNNNLGDMTMGNRNSGNQPHSWIVLKQPGLTPNAPSGGHEVCIDLWTQDANFAYLGVWQSFGAGFQASSGNGTTTARPVAADEQQLLSPYDIGAGVPRWYDDRNNWDARLYAWLSADGEQTRVMMLDTNGAKNLWGFEQALNPIDAWSGYLNGALPGAGAAYFASPNFGSTVFSLLTPNYHNFNNGDFNGNPGNQLAKEFWWANGLMGVRNWNNQTNYGAAMSCESAYGNPLTVALPVVNDWDQAGAFLPLGIAPSGVGGRGRIGTIGDLWFGPRNIPFGDTYPGDGSKKFVQFSDFIFPWNGSVPVFQ